MICYTPLGDVMLQDAMKCYITHLNKLNHFFYQLGAVKGQQDDCTKKYDAFSVDSDSRLHISMKCDVFSVYSGAGGLLQPSTAYSQHVLPPEAGVWGGLCSPEWGDLPAVYGDPGRSLSGPHHLHRQVNSDCLLRPQNVFG